LKIKKSTYIKLSSKNNAQYKAPKFKLSKKYKKYISIDKVGKVTAKKRYKKGKKYISITVKAYGKKLKIKVKVK
jgi:hypothetical protein